MAAPVHANLFGRKGPSDLSNHVLDFFQKDFNYQDDALSFRFQSKNANPEIEYWSAERHIVPRSAGVWIVNTGLPVQVRHLLLSHSVSDVLCFCHYKPSWLMKPDNIAFAALGLLASSNQVKVLKSCFTNAKVHTLFDDGIIGRVTDCKIALWMKGKDASFKVEEDFVEISLNKNRFTIPLHAFSLSRFEKTVSIRSGIRTHKPKEGFSCHHDFFIGCK
jgi:hypothetical protein